METHVCDADVGSFKYILIVCDVYSLEGPE